MKALFRTFCVFMFLFLGGAVSLLNARDLEISKARITTGGKTLSFLPSGSGAYLCFELENKSDDDQFLIVSIRSEAAQGEDQYFSSEFFAPAKSVQRCQFPFQLDGSRSYTISSDNRVQIADPELFVLTWKESDRLNLTVTDQPVCSGALTVNAYVRLPDFPDHCTAETVAGSGVPVFAHQLEHYRAILLYNTDFGKWQARSFDAVTEYVKNGGTLCFGTPQDAYNALQSPLKSLVPLTFLTTEFQKTDTADPLLNLRTNVSVPLFYLPAEPVDGAQKMSDTPGFVEKNIGKGVVRASVFDIWQFAEISSVTGYGKKMEMFLAGNPIPVREIEYTHTRLDDCTSMHFSFPQGRNLLAVIAFMLAGIFVLFILEIVLRAILGDRIKKWYSYVAVLIWCAGVLGVGCIKGGALFDWVPLPGVNTEMQDNVEVRK